MMLAAGRAPSRHPAARHGGEHLARHHRDVHLRPGAVLGACRYLGGRGRHARHARASISASRCRSDHLGASGVVAAMAKSRGDLGLVPAARAAPAPGGRRWRPTTRRRSSRGFLSSSAPIIRPAAGLRGSPGRTRRDGERSGSLERARVGAGVRRVSHAINSPAEVVAVPDRAFDGAALLMSVPERRGKTR